MNEYSQKKSNQIFGKFGKKLIFILVLTAAILTVSGLGYSYIQNKKFLIEQTGDNINQSQILEDFKKETLENFLVILVFIVLIIVVISILISRMIINPLKKLKEASEEIKKGNYKIKVEIKADNEFKDLSIAFNEMSEKLERIEETRKQIDESKTYFLSVTGHELRSPMTPIKAQLQMLLGDYFGKINIKQKEALEIILRNTDRLDNLIKELLEVSRIETARLKFNFVKFNLINQIKKIIKELDNILPEKKIKIELKIKGNIPEIEADPDRIAQILENLVENSKKFSEENTKITIEIEQAEKMILISVKDMGIGISKENQNKIFMPFFQEEQTMYRKYGGMGLGLSIVKGIVESQNGKIWFESERGKGTTFFFTIPLQPNRNPKPISILIKKPETESGLEIKIKDLFKKYFNSLWEREFNDFKRDRKLTKEDLFKYIELLMNIKRLDKKQGVSFKEDISKIFWEEKPEEDIEKFFNK